MRRALMQLAAQSGVWDVDEFAKTVPARTLTEWQLYWNMEGLTPEIEDHRWARLAHIEANQNRPRGKAISYEKFRIVRHSNGQDTAHSVFEKLKAGLMQYKDVFDKDKSNG